MSAVRTRRRIQVDKIVTDGMRALAREVYVANKAKNKAASDEKKAQTKLNQLIASATDGKALEFTDVVGDKTLDIKYAQGKKDVIDIAKLRKLASDSSFMLSIKSSRKAVVDNCGNNIEAACVEMVDGDWKAKVSARK